MSDPVSAIGGAISIGSGLIGSDAASSAADAQGQASAASIAEQRRQYDQARTDTAPYRASGQAANSLLDEYLGIGSGTGGAPATAAKTALDYNGWAASRGGERALNAQIGKGWPTRSRVYNEYVAKFNADPSNQARAAIPATHDQSIYGSLIKPFSYTDLNNDVVYNNGLQFGLDEGTKAIDNRARASGSYDSGAALKELTRYGNDYATTKTADAYARNTQQKGQIYDMLNGVTNRGVNAVGTVTGAGGTASSNISNALTDSGNARSAGIIGSNNAWQGALTGIAGQLPGLLGGATNRQAGTSIPIKF